MRKIIIVIVLLIVFYNNAYTQICDTINCSDIKDYVTTQITKAYLIDNLKVKSKTSKNDSINFKKIEPDLNSNKLGQSLKYDLLLKDLIENGFPMAGKNIAGPINAVKLSLNSNDKKELLSEKIMSQLLAGLSESRKEKIKMIPDLTNNITAEINSFILSKFDTPKTSKVKVINKENNDLVSDSNKPDQVQQVPPSFISNSFLLYFAIGISLLSLIFFILTFFKVTSFKRKYEAELHSLKKDNSSVINKGTNNLSKSELSRSDFERLLGNSEKFGEFYTKLNNLEISILNIKTISQPNIPSYTENAQISKPVDEETFYMTKPVGNSFPISLKSSSPLDTVYKFIIGNNKTVAEYEIHTQGAPVNEIIKRGEIYLVPGCDEENNPTNSTNKIITKNKGQVQLEGDKWVILRKALIKYE